MKTSFYSAGKLLITGEYAVLDGAYALAIPTRFGQTLSVMETSSGSIDWKSFDVDQHCWLEASFSVNTLELRSEHTEESENLGKLLQIAQKLNPAFLKHCDGLKVETHLQFSRKWGLGSSSTLLNNIAQWAAIDPYQLLKNRFSGSGYDIACAGSKQPILYRIKKGIPEISPIDFNPSFKDNLYFVYLNKKQNSLSAVVNYKKTKPNKKLTDEISLLAQSIAEASTLFEFEKLIKIHESIVSKLIGQKPVQQELFSDFTGTVKSLGAWGGDFALATGSDNVAAYFESKGYTTVIPFSDMI
jgi:mevalonate kinase